MLGSNAAAWAQAKKEAVVLIVGDSLSAEYGLKRGSGWAALLQERLGQEKVPARVVNASVSGDTTSGGRSRLPALLKQHQRRWIAAWVQHGAEQSHGLPMNAGRGLQPTALLPLSIGNSEQLFTVGWHGRSAVGAWGAQVRPARGAV